MFTDYLFSISRYAVLFLSVVLLIRNLRSLLSGKAEPETWAYLRVGEENVPIQHWESLIGRTRSADLRLFGEGISPIHAVLKRTDKGRWFVYDVFSKGGVWVNGKAVPVSGTNLQHGDTVNFGGSCVRFLNLSTEQRQRNEQKRTGAGVRVNPVVSLAELTMLQLFLLLQHSFSARQADMTSIALAFATLVVLEWCVYEAMRLLDRTGFELELLAFYLTTLGLSVAASAVPEDLYKQILLIVASVFLFLFSGWWMSNLKRTNAMRIPVGILALALLALNILTSDKINGAKSWLEFGGYSFQPSELVKVFYIYVGAATLDALYMKRNLYSFILYSAACVSALALIGDFGTALVFFTTFLVISFMRSGSLATVLLAVTGAVLAGLLAMTVRPYIARRFAVWGHVWDDVYGAGYQQTRSISATASGGLIGKGAGAGWLRGIAASDTDMVFAYICEEQGLIIGLCMIFSVILMALFAVKCAKNGRSAYFSIAACATAALMLVQLALNVFGTLDLLPFTGVTFPFVSRGGSSLLSCWMLLAYLKAADNRRGASFAVDPVNRIMTWEEEHGVEVVSWGEEQAAAGKKKSL
ncbi:MAG: FtsW/RodA/SpoVE family cell cycle protein [Oscillospiraceae bacterium]|nr:FtsW/RodA/SpoVE family cell cycle protein [Oscillospiraceae bacterium]